MSVQYGLLQPEQLPAYSPLIPSDLRQQQETLYFIGAVQDHHACGVLVFRADEMTADILHIAVSESYQRQGIADGLLSFLCEYAGETSTAVLCTFAAADRDDPLCRLLTHRGDFTLEESEGFICRVSCADLEDVDLDLAPPADHQIMPFYRLPDELQHDFFSRLENEHPQHAQGLINSEDDMLDPLCLCSVENSTVQSVVFCQGLDGDVMLSFAYACPNQTRSLIALVSYLRTVLLRASDKVPYLWIAAVTAESQRLVNTLLPQREIVKSFYTACWDMNTMGG